MSRKGGYVLYSTCSLNPIEDEAVVSDVFRRV
jgi:multisite-specific tRNA:(cytosine-C5)-methyltransferase